MVTTVLIYPVGWDAELLRDEACGPEADQYKLGDCTLEWAFWLSAASALFAVLTACLSPAARKDTESLYSRGYTI